MNHCPQKTDLNLTKLEAAAVNLPGTSITLHQMMLIVGGICMGGTVLGSLYIFLSHLKWRATYVEQSP